MGGLYNMAHGYSLACLLVAPMLTDKNPERFFPRFRDCFLSDDCERILVYTRVGGGNREDWKDEIARLRAMPTYIGDEDDDFDSTYATFEFGVPEEWKEDFDRVVALDLASLSDAYVERMQECYPALDVRNILLEWREASDEHRRHAADGES